MGTHSHKDMDVISSTGEAPSCAYSRLDGVGEKSVEDKKDGREKKQTNKNRSSGRETAGCTKLVSDGAAQCLSSDWAGTVTVHKHDRKLDFYALCLLAPCMFRAIATEARTYLFFLCFLVFKTSSFVRDQGTELKLGTVHSVLSLCLSWHVT